MISFCPIHGNHSAKIDDINAYFDLNTQLRDLLKSIDFLDDESKLSIMCDASDWSGSWDRKVNIESLLKLGYKRISPRIFLPLILDWSGAKFSKSMYIIDESYSNRYMNIINYKNFMDTYGNEGFNKLWFEINSWVNDPKKFFRNYSIEYITQIIQEKELLL